MRFLWVRPGLRRGRKRGQKRLREPFFYQLATIIVVISVQLRKRARVPFSGLIHFIQAALIFWLPIGIAVIKIRRNMSCSLTGLRRNNAQDEVEDDAVTV
jgi:hypothetical protein